MNVAVLTVGDELLSGDTDNTNGTWLARELAERGADVRRILALPDDRETIADDFVGDLDSRFLYTVQPEANIVSELRAVRERFGVRVGCYPDREARHNRLKLTGSDEQLLNAATEWLLDAIDASETPSEARGLE